MKRSLVAVLPMIAIIAVVAGVTLGQDSPRRETESLNIDAEMPTYNSLDELVRASASIVIARATEVRDGRTIGSDTDPNATIRTQVVTLLVGEVLFGPATDTLSLEQEIALGDGTPITVNQMRPTAVGDEGLFFLQAGDSETLPHAALVNHQARYLVAGASRDQLVSASPDPLSIRLASLGPYDLRCQVLTRVSPGTDCTSPR